VYADRHDALRRDLARFALGARLGSLGRVPEGRPALDRASLSLLFSSLPREPETDPTSSPRPQPIVTPEWLLACARAHKLVPIAPYYLGQTNRAASLSSAQLVTAQGEPRARPVAGAGAAASSSRPQPVQEEREPEQEQPQQQQQQQQQRDVIELQEDVEAPPDDSVVRNEVERAPEAAQASASASASAPPPPAVVVDSPELAAAETDASIKGFKSDEDEASAPAPPAAASADDEVPLAQAPPAAADEDDERDSAQQEAPSVPEVVIDAPAEELEREVEKGEVVPEGDAAAERAEEVPIPVGTGEGEGEGEREPQLDEAEEAESDVDEGQLEGEGEGEGDASLVDVKL